jgi:hypothetical protein
VPGLGWIIGRGFYLWKGPDSPVPGLGWIIILVSFLGRGNFPCARIRLENCYRYRVLS